MHRILTFCMNTNIFVSLASFSLYKVTEILFNFQDTNLGLFIFFSTLFAYNYMRTPLFLNRDVSNSNFTWNQNHKNSIQIIFFISGCMMLYLICLLGFKFVKLISPAIIISLLYPLSIKISTQEYSIRRIPFLKIFLISMTWSYITFLVPLLYYDFEINYFLLDFLFQRVLFIIAISIPFDMRDCDYDHIKTIPNTIGIYQSKLFAWFCLFMIDMLLIIDLINNTITVPVFVALFLCIEICSVLIYFSNNNRSQMFYGILVESLSIIMCLFVLIASFF